MKKKLSQKEREEIANKGFLEDHFEYLLKKDGYVTSEFLLKNGFITKEYLENVLENKNILTKEFLDDKKYITSEHLKKKDYVSKKYAHDMFDYYQSDMKHHIDSLIEQQHDYFRAIIETLQGRFERNEDKLENLDRRVTRLEIKPSF